MNKMSNLSSFRFKLLFLVMMLPYLISHCTPLQVDVEPDASVFFQSLKLSVQVKNLNTNENQSFKVIFKYNTLGDKMVFLSPLNQVYGLLFVAGENTLLINTKEKKYWRGQFNQLIQYLWGEDMDFSFSEFKNLVIDGVLPQAKVTAHDLKITVDKVDMQKKPERMHIQSPDILVKVKISGRQSSSGKLSLTSSLKGMQAADLNHILK